jgi:hypothetical protein
MKLPKVIADLIAAQDKYDSQAFAENFSDDAIVHDEGKTYYGKTEIRKWNEMTNSKYKTNYEPIADFSKGGLLELWLGAQPNLSWGKEVPSSTTKN